MTRHLRNGSPRTWRRVASLAAAAVPLLAFAILARDASGERGTAASVLSPSLGSPALRLAEDLRIPSDTARLPSPAILPMAPSGVLLAGETASVDEIADDALSADLPPASGTPSAPVLRSAKPARETAIARRLGWTPGDGREAALAAWLDRPKGAGDAQLDALFGPEDADAIARDLAPIPTVDDR